MKPRSYEGSTDQKEEASKRDFMTEKAFQKKLFAIGKWYFALQLRYAVFRVKE